ncbi:hypothetical protein, partial [Apilactobacillus waqarii]
MNKKFKNMTLAIIPLSVMLLSTTTGAISKADVSISNSKINDSDKGKKITDRDLLEAANKIQNYLYDYYNESIGYVKGSYIEELAKASLYDVDVQKEFSKEINQAKAQTLSDKNKDIKNTNELKKEISNEANYLEYIDKALNEASSILKNNSNDSFKKLKSSVESDLNNLNKSLNDDNHVQNTDMYLNELKNEVKSTKANIDSYNHHGYEAEAMNEMSHMMDDSYNIANDSLSKAIKHEKENNSKFNDMINAEKKHDAEEKVADKKEKAAKKAEEQKEKAKAKAEKAAKKAEEQKEKAKAKAEKAAKKAEEQKEKAKAKAEKAAFENSEKENNSKYAKAEKVLNDLLNHEKEQNGEVKDLIDSDNMKDQLAEDAEIKKSEKAADAKMAEVDKAFNDALKQEKEDAAFDKSEEENDAKMAEVDKAFKDSLNHEKEQNAEVKNLIDSDNMKDQLAEDAQIEKSEKAADAKMAEVDKAFKDSLNHEKEQNAEVKDLIDSDNMKDQLAEDAKIEKSEKAA